MEGDASVATSAESTTVINGGERGGSSWYRYGATEDINISNKNIINNNIENSANNNTTNNTVAAATAKGAAAIAAAAAAAATAAAATAAAATEASSKEGFRNIWKFFDDLNINNNNNNNNNNTTNSGDDRDSAGYDNNAGNILNNNYKYNNDKNCDNYNINDSNNNNDSGSNNYSSSSNDSSNSNNDSSSSNDSSNSNNDSNSSNIDNNSSNNDSNSSNIDNNSSNIDNNSSNINSSSNNNSRIESGSSVGGFSSFLRKSVESLQNHITEEIEKHNKNKQLQQQKQHSQQIQNKEEKENNNNNNNYNNSNNNNYKWSKNNTNNTTTGDIYIHSNMNDETATNTPQAAPSPTDGPSQVSEVGEEGKDNGNKILIKTKEIINTNNTNMTNPTIQRETAALNNVVDKTSVITKTENVSVAAVHTTAETAATTTATTTATAATTTATPPTTTETAATTTATAPTTTETAATTTATAAPTTATAAATTATAATTTATAAATTATAATTTAAAAATTATAATTTAAATTETGRGTEKDIDVNNTNNININNNDNKNDNKTEESYGVTKYITATMSKVFHVSHKQQYQDDKNDNNNNNNNIDNYNNNKENNNIKDIIKKNDNINNKLITEETIIVDDDTSISTSTATDAEIKKLVEDRRGVGVSRALLPPSAVQTLAKKCVDQDDSKPEWFAHKRHSFIFTYSGKPVYTRYGSEESLSGFTGAMSAIISKMEKFFFTTNSTDVLDYMYAGGVRFKFLIRGPFYFAAVDSASPSGSVTSTLLMLMHRQLLCILTRGVEKSLYARPNFDVRQLMGGTDCVFRGLHKLFYKSMVGVYMTALLPSNMQQQLKQIKNSNNNSNNNNNNNSSSSSSKNNNGKNIQSIDKNDNEYNNEKENKKKKKKEEIENKEKQLLIESAESKAIGYSGAYETLPLNNTMRIIAIKAIKYFGTNNVVAAFLVADFRVAALSLASGLSISATDVILLINFVHSSLALRHAESWTPVCVPGVDDKGFMHAYVRYFSATVFLICLSVKGDSDTFHQLSTHSNKSYAVLTNTGCLAAIESSREIAPYALPRSLWGEIEAIHASILCPSLRQFFSSAFSDDYKNQKHKQQMVYQEYQRCLSLLAESKEPAHVYVESAAMKTYVWLSQEMYFFCCVPSWIELSTTLVEQLARWLMEQKSFLFISDVGILA